MLTDMSILKFSKIESVLNSSIIIKHVSNLYTKRINPSNVCYHYEISKHFHQTDLHTYTKKYIQRWFCLLVANNEHLDLSFDLIENVLSSSDLEITSEIELLNAADFWIKHDGRKRSKFAIKLIKKIRLPLLTIAALEKLLTDGNSFSKCVDCKNYIQKAISNKLEKSVDLSSIDCQHRYCSQENFEIMPSGRTLKKYKIFKLNNRTITEDTSLKVMVGSSLDSRNSVFINGVVYFFNNNVVNSYSIFTNVIEEFNLPNKHLGRFCACNFMGRIYILGGYSENPLGYGRSCFVFNPTSKTWEERSKMKDSRIDAACAVFGGRVVVSGGGTELQRVPWIQEKKTVEVYDQCSNEWSQLPNMIEARSGHASVSIKNKLYVISGIGTRQCEVFDSFSRVFVRILPEMPLLGLRNRIEPMCAALGSKIIIFRSLRLEENVLFDVEKEEWSEVKENVSPIRKGSKNRCFFCSCLKIPWL